MSLYFPQSISGCVSTGSWHVSHPQQTAHLIQINSRDFQTGNETIKYLDLNEWRNHWSFFTTVLWFRRYVILVSTSSEIPQATAWIGKHTSVGVRITAWNPNCNWFSDWFYLTLLFQMNTLYSVWWGRNVIMHGNYVWVWKVFGGRYLPQGDLAQLLYRGRGGTKIYTDLIQGSWQLSQIPFEHMSRKSTINFWVSHLHS
jgi:hypothetical protein